jgi:hypothetical protein
LPLPIEDIEFIASANRLVVNEDLGHGSAAICPIGHSHTGGSVSVNFVLNELSAFPAQQQLGSNAVGAGLPGVNFDLGVDSFSRSAEQEGEQWLHCEVKRMLIGKVWLSQNEEVANHSSSQVCHAWLSKR